MSALVYGAGGHGKVVANILLAVISSRARRIILPGVAVGSRTITGTGVTCEMPDDVVAIDVPARIQRVVSQRYEPFF